MNLISMYGSGQHWYCCEVFLPGIPKIINIARLLDRHRVEIFRREEFGKQFRITYLEGAIRR